MKTLVTGGCGFVGSNLVRALLERGDSVDVVDNLSTGTLKNIQNLNAKFILWDVRDRAISKKKYDVIYHLAALARIQPSFASPKITHDINSSGTINVLQYAAETGARVVYAGSSSFYHDVYANPYTYSKWLGEEHCKLYSKVYGVSTVIARFFNVYGPNQITEGDYATVIGIFERQKLRGLPLTITGDGEQRRDFTHVDDIVEGLILLGMNRWDAEVYNFGTGTNYSINEVARMFQPVLTEYLPKRPGEAETTLADIEKTVSKLGWKPKRRLENYVEDVVTAYQELSLVRHLW